MNHEILQRAADLAFVGPEIKIALAISIVRSGTTLVVARRCRRLIDMGVREYYRVDILGVDDPASAMLFC